MLPIEPFDNQIFIDAFKIKWVYASSMNVWTHQGKIDTIPLADSSTTGLLSKQLKTIIDAIPQKGGGYAIITKPLLRKFRTAGNPDGVIYGNITLKSNSFDLNCVNANGEILSSINCEQTPIYQEGDEFPPGFDINFSKAFTNSFCIVVPGGPGPRGLQGDRGATGQDGTGDGPQGNTGKIGVDATTHWALSGVKIVETDDIFDTAVVKLELRADTGQMVVTKGKIKLPTDTDLPVEEFLAQRIQRRIKFSKCFEFTLTAIPCSPTDPITQTNSELLEPDPIIIFYPQHFDPTNTNITRYQPTRAKLSDLVNDIIQYYKDKLTEAATKWDAQLEKFITEQDKAARTVLDDIANELAACEQTANIEFCLGVNKDCCDQNIATVNDPVYTTILEELGCDVNASKTTNISISEITSTSSPVFSFDAVSQWSLPGDLSGGSLVDGICEANVNNGCWLQYINGALSFVPPGTFVPRGTIQYGGPWGCGILPPKIRTDTTPDATNPTQVQMIADLEAERDATSTTPFDRDRIQEEIDKILGGYPTSNLVAKYLQVWNDNLSTQLSNGYMAYKKQKIPFTGGGFEFPSGTYAFTYLSGAFIQPLLSEGQRWGYGPENDIFIHGNFQKYWVGNEGGSSGRGPFFILNQYNRSRRTLFNTKAVTDEIGLEIGFAPIGYEDFIPVNYFDVYAYNPNAGFAPFQTECSNVATSKLDAATILMENNITWYPFPVLGAAQNDPNSTQMLYGQQPLSNKSVMITAATPGYFFARVKLAYSATNFFGSIMMPPLTTYGLTNYSINRALMYEEHRFAAPTFVTQPVAVGSVKIQALKIDCVGSVTGA
jgi:hypothetical protein